MADKEEKIPLEARLLSDAIIELNISRRNVSIYPRDHPSVDKSLSRAFEYMQKLFELRPEITLAIARDTLIIDDYYLDKQNPVYREFALNLSRMNIAHVTFTTGLTKDELYEFHRFISGRVDEVPAEIVGEKLRELNLIHIRAGLIDYGAFLFEEGKTSREKPAEQLWERYIYGMLEGTLNTEDMPEEFREIPPEVLARFVNTVAADDLKEETYDRVITTYMRRSSETAFSSKDLKRLLGFINGLKPELKKQFLTSSLRTFTGDMDSTDKALREVSVDEVIELLSAINEQKLAIPEALKNLLDKLSGLPQEAVESLSFESGLLVDDIFLAPDIANLLGEASFSAFIDDAYQKEIQKLLDFKAKGVAPAELREWEREYSDDAIEKDFNQALLELLLSDILSEEEYLSFVNLIRDQSVQFMWTGQYGQLLSIIRVLDENAGHSKFSAAATEALRYYHSGEFITGLISSLRMLGRQMRAEAWLLCQYYGERIIPSLLDALVQEGSQTVRRFFMELLKQFGAGVIPEAIKRLGDPRWFVKRNMLYILSEINNPEVLPSVRPYCRHENLKVSVEAIKCLLSAGDRYGIQAVKDYLYSESREQVEQAISLTGAFRIKEFVPDLIKMLKKRGISGADLYDKMPVVRALGDISDPAALPALRDVLSEKSILFKGSAERLKEEIYSTLKNYQREDIQDMIDAGLRSKSEYIREESLRLGKARAD
jgi:HEAT repeat protein